MASVNKVILIGNLGKDPETRYLPSGDAVTNIRIATTDTWKDKSGEKQEHTEWHRIAFLRQARRDRGRIPEERLAGLRRRPHPHAQVAGQGRPGPLFDRDRRRPHAAPRRARRRGRVDGARARSGGRGRCRRQARRQERRRVRRNGRRHSVLAKPALVSLCSLPEGGESR